MQQTDADIYQIYSRGSKGIVVPDGIYLEISSLPRHSRSVKKWCNSGTVDATGRTTDAESIEQRSEKEGTAKDTGTSLVSVEQRKRRERGRKRLFVAETEAKAQHGDEKDDRERPLVGGGRLYMCVLAGGGRAAGLEEQHEGEDHGGPGTPRGGSERGPAIGPFETKPAL